MGLPETIRIEVKITTGEAVSLPARELSALAVSDDSEIGVLATLFWCGDRGVDGRWLIADAADSFRPRASKTTLVSKAAMERAHRGQPWLCEFKQHIEKTWRPFLQAFYEEAMSGHEALCEELRRCHEEETTESRLNDERILDTDHRGAVRGLIEHHGENVAGHIFQDLFAYLTGHVGYRTVILNPVGVPDVTVTDLRRADGAQDQLDLGTVRVEDARRLLSYCKQAGDEVLAARIAKQLATRDDPEPF